MNNLEIRAYATGHPTTREIFRGVYPIDLLPTNKKKKRGVYIVNLDPSTGEGSHWVAVDIGGGKTRNIYFDSYGMAAQDKRLKKFLGKHYKKNLKRLQHPLTTTCGQWCLYFLLRRSENWSMEEIVKPFSKNVGHPLTLLNDHVLNYLIKMNFKERKENKVIDRRFLKDQLRKQVALHMITNLRKLLR